MAISAMASNGNGVDPTRPYRVRVPNPNWTASGQPESKELTIWAHQYTIIDGCLMFVVVEAKEIVLPTENGQQKRTQALVTTYPETFAPGQWEHVSKVFVPPADASKIAN